MSDTPERIWAEPGLPGYVDEPWDVYTVQYIRADLHDDLVKAADALAEAAADVDKLWALEAHDRMMIALTAYLEAKEKMNAL